MNLQEAAMHPDALDEHTVAFYLEVKASHIVLLQSFFEMSEGIGVVRTLNVPKNQVCVLTTRALADACCNFLHALRQCITWREIPKPPEADEQLRGGSFGALRTLCSR